jgi:hypothetical protein
MILPRVVVQAGTLAPPFVLEDVRAETIPQIPARGLVRRSERLQEYQVLR